ncbi:MAG: RluA family pseudouridine synthase [Bacillota bacterium]|nr:RluA family pseudouridine synthase [Bacillota bacterium]
MPREFDEGLEYVALDTDPSVRLDKFVATVFPQYSRTLIQRLIKDGDLNVDGKTVKPSYVVTSGDVIQITEIPITEIDAIPEDIPLDIVYEDADVVVVDKPAGMVVHPAPGNYTGTLVNALLFHFKDLSGAGGSFRPGIVHRIDKDTSGLLMVAKNDFAHNALAAELKEKKTKREYVAIVDGVIKNNFGVIDAPIGRDIRDRKKMAITPNGKSAVTRFEVLERFPDATFVKCVLETGRTHQIRVHLQSIGHPVAGDPIYGKKGGADPHGQYLHARTLGFTHPISQEALLFSAPLPDYFEAKLALLRRF